jgi:hypothetical protein
LHSCAGDCDAGVTHSNRSAEEVFFHRSVHVRDAFIIQHWDVAEEAG